MPAQLTHDRPIRWGILGAGGIAGRVSQDISRTDGNVVAAVAAREADRAAEFASRFQHARSYGSYRDLAADPDVDVIYIATTHPGHHDHALMAIDAGKAVLIEKPLCLNAADTREVLVAARAADVFSMEAMWMRTNPLIRKAEQLIADGIIGEVRSVRAELPLGLAFDPGHRLYDLDNGGGALLDLGVYPVTFAYLFLGLPDTVSVTGSLSPTGSDATVAMQWGYANGRDAHLWCSAPLDGPNRGILVGSDGWISTDGKFHRPSGLTVHRADGQTRLDDPGDGPGNGYRPEIAEVARCMRAGLIESPLIPHADTIAIMELLDAARAELGVKYPGE
jgi:predicted dehydrogenase